MNDLVRTGGRSPAPAKPSDQPRVVQIARGLTQASAAYERPYEDAIEASANVLHVAIRLTHSVFSPISTDAQAKRWLEATDPLPDPGIVRRECEAMLSEGPDTAATALLVGMMLDAFPNTGRETRDGYLATLTHEIVADGHGPHIVAVATRQLRRTAKFPPTIGEVLEACDSAAKALRTRCDTMKAAELRLREARGIVAKGAH